MNRALPLRLQALHDLVKRYGGVIQHAWRERANLDLRPRLPHEAQFLPAALELQETPVSPAPRVAMWLLVAFALIAISWAVFGRIDVVASAHGKIVPGDRTKVIQPIETATVKAIHVTDGQTVKAGDVLIELDATNAAADIARLTNDLVIARLQAARAQALLGAIDTGAAPVLGSVHDVGAVQLAQEQRLLKGQYSEYQAKLARIDADIAKREAEIRSTQEIIRKLEQTAPIARQRAQDFKDLVEKNFISKHGYLEKEQARIEQEADLATQRGRLKELMAALQEGRGDRSALVAETRRLALDSFHEGDQKAATYEQELVKAQSRGKLMTLTAPLDGTVQQLAVHTVGGVVTPAQQLMVLVPQDSPVEVEAYVDNRDIGFVNPGQEAEVKIETFPFTKYGTIHAHVTHLSRDAVNDEKRGLIFPARVNLERGTIQVESKTVNLSPGMAVTVEVKTAQRRVIEYFLSPLLQYKDESLRER
ncbi:HlyD family type I secretion periplasmic adaptor subunit [Azoarcus sp. KH32C]|uniref:HlyD family type I secretion periplasmic adaptor subunit n=1 Tax=Azoarcus sp. KH32C TaxID=748247 RepID=UPI00023863E0|nr:HlyD family type I secretion periplasmic adaptor subunit [Azoarcus sp. KH32C]BAL24635.1 HlyD-family type I secretion protein [Azoarcus sp. KH32C]